MIRSRTYTEMARSAHEAGGETQAEATARMSATTLRRMSVGSKSHVLSSLVKEANACETLADYNFVRDQIVRVRQALVIR